jgi:hypothetical protein
MARFASDATDIRRCGVRVWTEEWEGGEGWRGGVGGEGGGRGVGGEGRGWEEWEGGWEEWEDDWSMLWSRTRVAPPLEALPCV